MKKNIINRLLIGLTTAVLSIGLIGCGNSSTSNADSDEKKVLTIGVSPGPYNELFDKAVKPILENQGYEIKSIDFSDYFNRK